ncbi:MAG: cytochrome P450 [Alphaproteobacteria bacterium]|nr:cytochrome P450 [Alphaproteobacteria bacterium]MCB9930600.1 cytochrome P450 [Alphaproteobacteria bacterium]
MNAPLPSLDLATLDVADDELYRTDTWYEPFALLRREDPVHFCPESAFGPYWSVTKYNDIMQVELAHDTYSNQVGGIQVRDPKPGLETESFIRMDPPRHTIERKTVAPIVAPFNLKNFTPIIRDRTNYVLDSLPKNEAFDWVDMVSIELTTMMLATLFDFPWEERRKLTYWSDVATFTDYGAPDALVRSEEERFEELKKMAEYFRALWDERREQEPRFDLISMLAHGQETKEMSLREFIGNLGLLIVGGNDTTRNSMSGGLYYLNKFPDEYAKARADHGLVPKLVAETIRYQTPVIHMRRTALKDTELGGKQIRKGDKVVMWYVSGNRDEEVIPDADKFIVDRAKPRQHLSYGAGIHRCVGDRLADLQLSILWEEILKRDLRIEVLEEPVRLKSNFIRGIRKMPAIIHA